LTFYGLLEGTQNCKLNKTIDRGKVKCKNNYPRRRQTANWTSACGQSRRQYGTTQEKDVRLTLSVRSWGEGCVWRPCSIEAGWPPQKRIIGIRLRMHAGIFNQ
jgi:hypothetical protein